MDTMRIAIPADDRLVAEISDVALADAVVAGVLVLATVAIELAVAAVRRATGERTWTRIQAFAHLQQFAWAA